MAKKKSFIRVKKALLSWVKQVKNYKVGRETADFDVMYVIDDSDPRFLEFRFDSDIYDIINEYGSYCPSMKLHNKFTDIMSKYNGEFYNSSIVRFY